MILQIRYRVCTVHTSYTTNVLILLLGSIDNRQKLKCILYIILTLYMYNDCEARMTLYGYIKARFIIYEDV